MRQKDSSGNHLNSYAIRTDEPLVIVFTSGEIATGFPVLLYPGDTCKVYTNDKNKFVFQSNNHETDDLTILTAIEATHGFVLPDNLGLTITNRLDIMYIVDGIKKKYSDRVHFIKEYKKSHTISNEYEATIKKLIYQKYLLSLLFPVYAGQDSVGYNFENLPAEYHDILKNETNDVFDDSQINFQSYQLVLWNYCKYLSRRSLNTSEEFVSMFGNAKKHFYGKSREFLMFLILKKYTGKGLPDFQRSAEAFLREYPESDYREHLARLIPSDLTNDMITLSNEKLVSYNVTDVTWKEIIDLNKGKVIYVDFWASWCKPCLQEMPYSASLRDSLNTKNVTFLYVSIDQNNDSWIRAANKLKFDPSQHFLFKKESKLKNLFALQAIPKYIIIDKKGNIFSPDAPRPSDPRLHSTLVKLLNE
ncbi:MAG: TlpA family protein disulfide reductase [Cytophagales bacterium]|nr:TlpA family protein disulfide reductase [Cytophagales bacterium]HMR56063.1 TlpA disulfide reductase family protein [Cyclobacteriaceae bacterium]